MTVVLGLLIAFGPQYLFLVDFACGCCIAHCVWSAQTLIGLGIVISALGLCFIVYTDPKTQFGLNISIFLTGLISMLIFLVIIGGCEVENMKCRTTAFHILTVLCSLVLAGSAFNIFTYFGYTPSVRHHNVMSGTKANKLEEVFK
jgi:hypothetical protein